MAGLAPESREPSCWLQRPCPLLESCQHHSLQLILLVRKHSKPGLQPRTCPQGHTCGYLTALGTSGTQWPCPQLSREKQSKGALRVSSCHLRLPQRTPCPPGPPWCRERAPQTAVTKHVHAAVCVSTERPRKVHSRPVEVVCPVGSEGRGAAFTSFPDSRKCGLWMIIALRVCFSSYYTLGTCSQYLL